MPAAPLQVVDFNGDYANDIILAVRGGLFGYVQVQHLSQTMMPDAWRHGSV